MPQPYSSVPATGGPLTQVGALCLREGAAGPEVLMLTSRTTRRWLVPKGWPIPGLSPAAAALQEAWEEAGVRGSVGEAPVGAYRYAKLRKSGVVLPCRVDLYQVAVAGLAEDYPEARRRDRAWVALDAAAQIAGEAELGAYLAALARKVSAGTALWA